jgi:sec-independent protein translocase protein TatC
MSIVEHLEALRRALIISVLAWGILTLAAFFVSGQAYDLLLHRAHLPHAYVFNPTGGFTIRLKIALYIGIVVSAPVIFWQMWWFISPGLHAHERRLILPLIAATTVFFLIGVGFALFSLPLILRVLTGFLPSDITYFPNADDLLGFVLALVLAFGLVFELPVVLWTLGMLKIISSRWLYQHRIYWVIGMGVLANFMTPGADPFTPMLVFFPLWFFWEGTALLLKLTGR